MNCRAFRNLLQQRLDGSLLDDASYDAHRHGCRDCADLHAASVQLLVGLRLTTPPAPPADLQERITAAVQRRRLGRVLRQRRVTVPLALAACLLIAIGARLLLGQWLTTTTPAPAWQIAQPGPAPDAEPKGLRDSVTEASAAVVSLTNRAAGEAVDSTRWLLPKVPPTVVKSPPPPATLPVQALQQAGEQAGAGVRDGLAPVANTARRAMDLILRELPVDLSDNRGL